MVPSLWHKVHRYPAFGIREPEWFPALGIREPEWFPAFGIREPEWFPAFGIRYIGTSVPSLGPRILCV